MRNFLRTAPAAALLILASSAFAQPDWYAHRDERWRDEHWRGRLFTEVKEDLDHVQGATEAFRVGDQYRLVRTKQELGELQSDLENRRYNQVKLDEVIGAMQKVVADNRMPERDRNVLTDDLRHLRDYREHHEGWGR
jgi:hypothetical protein